MYFLLEGFDFGVHAAPVRPALGRGAEHGASSDRSGTGTRSGSWWPEERRCGSPAWYATMFSGFYLALLLILVLLIVRVVSFEWRAAETPGWRSTWTWANTIGSFGAPLLWGIGLSCLVYGTPIDSDGDYPGSLLDLFSPYSVFREHCSRGALRVPRRDVPHAPDGGSAARPCQGGRRSKTRAPHGRRARYRVPCLDRRGRDGSQRQGSLPTAIPAAVRIAALVLAVVFLFARNTGRAFAMTALGTISLVATLFVSLYPRVMVSSTDFENSLTVDDAASSTRSRS